MDPSDHDGVEYILLDPSCSGSGIINRDDHLTAVGTTKVIPVSYNYYSSNYYSVIGIC